MIKIMNVQNKKILAGFAIILNRFSNVFVQKGFYYFKFFDRL